MSDPQLGSVQERRILIVEDEYIIAFDLTRSLEELGIQVVGPASGVAEALRLVVTDGDRLNGAILDINLRGERVYQVAQALAARGVPFMFATGYETSTIPDAYATVPRCEKPVDKARLVQWLSNNTSSK